MPLDALERSLCEDIAAGADDLVALAAALIARDTTAGAGPREEPALQEMLAERLGAVGMAVDLWVPDAADVADAPQVPDGFSFAGRPQLIARRPGVGYGRSLLFCGHVDVVSPGPLADWSAPPTEPVVRHRRLFGRGACDMKGGVAAMVFAAETLARIELAGELVVCTVTDEEESGAGALAAVARGLRADAAMLPEPSSFDAWVAVRGAAALEVTIDGRLGHAGLEHGEHGAVNAISKASLLLAGVADLDAGWRTTQRHPYLSPGHVVPTVVGGGDWDVNVPARCTFTLHLAHLPTEPDAARQLEATLEAVAQADPWLAAHPPRLRWLRSIPACEVPGDGSIVEAALDAGADVGRPGRISGLDSWHDGATLTLRSGTPAIALGPREIAVAHTVDEHVPVEDLVACAQLYAVAAMRFCGLPVLRTGRSATAGRRGAPATPSRRSARAGSEGSTRRR